MSATKQNIKLKIAAEDQKNNQKRSFIILVIVLNVDSL